MKKFLIVLVIVLIGVCVFYFQKNKSHSSIIASATNEISTNISLNTVSGLSQQPPTIIEKPTVKNVSSNPTSMSNMPTISNCENISDLKQLPSLKLLQTYPNSQVWISDGVSIQFQFKLQNDKILNFEANFIDAEINQSSGRIQQLEFHSTWLNIDQVRELGQQLNDSLGLDSASFLTWCNETANKTIDIQPFSSASGSSPAPDKIIGYGIHPTFNGEKPFYIRLVIYDK